MVPSTALQYTYFNLCSSGLLVCVRRGNKDLFLQATFAEGYREQQVFFSTLTCQPHALHIFSAAAGTKGISKISMWLTNMKNVKAMACAAVGECVRKRQKQRWEEDEEISVKVASIVRVCFAIVHTVLCCAL